MTDEKRVPERARLEAVDFLVTEAELLDNRRFREWLDLLTEDVVYRVPVRVTLGKDAGSDLASAATWFDETYRSLETRIRRLEAKFPVAEDPPSRTRHFLSNLRVRPGDQNHELRVAANILVYRSRGDSTNHDLFSAERNDVLRRGNGGWKLARREVLLDQSVLGAQDISFLF